MSIETWPTLEPGQVRWLGEWEDAGFVSGRYFVGRHSLGAIHAGTAIATDETAEVPPAPWWAGSGWAVTSDRDTAKRETERFVAEMFGAEVKAR